MGTKKVDVCKTKTERSEREQGSGPSERMMVIWHGLRVNCSSAFGSLEPGIIYTSVVGCNEYPKQSSLTGNLQVFNGWRDCGTRSGLGVKNYFTTSRLAPPMLGAAGSLFGVDSPPGSRLFNNEQARWPVGVVSSVLTREQNTENIKR
ncbi:hypothetical protein J6590_011570 [Homalodisca vitripennis]|nr:hypothetical protein J6590_011570 [Homalodisca vitripennis]